MSSQQQDLVFFSDGTLLSSAVTPQRPPLFIISHHDGTAPTWLVSVLVENSLVGTAGLVNRDLRPAKTDCSVAYVSFLRASDDVKKAARKHASDSLRFRFLEYSASLFAKVPAAGDTAAHIDLLFDDIAAEVGNMSTAKRIVFLEAPELLLASTAAASADVLGGIKTLNKMATVVPIINIHTALVNMDACVPQDTTFRVTDFYVKLHYMSSLNVSLQPLPTGKAKDITGSLTITRGAVPEPGNLDVVEHEYVFHVTKDTAAKLYYR